MSAAVINSSKMEAISGSAEVRLHNVDKRDTLMGLSLKYGISADAIRRANDMPTDNLSTFKVIRIPLSKNYKVLAPVGDEDSHAALLRRFRVKNGISEPEARAYLEVADWDYDAAQRSFTQDISFENTHRADLAKFLEAAAAPSPEKLATTSLTEPLELDAFELGAEPEAIPLLDSSTAVRSTGIAFQPTGSVRRRTATSEKT